MLHRLMRPTLHRLMRRMLRRLMHWMLRRLMCRMLRRLMGRLLRRLMHRRVHGLAGLRRGRAAEPANLNLHQPRHRLELGIEVLEFGITLALELLDVLFKFSLVGVDLSSNRLARSCNSPRMSRIDYSPRISSVLRPQPPRSGGGTPFILRPVVQTAFQFGEVAKPLPYAGSLNLD